MTDWKQQSSPLEMPTCVMTDEQVAEAIKKICLAFGSSVPTAFKVAGLFVEGTRKERT